MGCKITDAIQTNMAILDENHTAQQATTVMLTKHIGLVVVTRGKEVVGVFSERDLVHRVVSANKDPAQVLLKEVMTRNLIKVRHDSSCKHCLDVMEENRCRHLLAFDSNKLVGVVSIRHVASLMGSVHTFREIMLNVFGGFTIIFAIITVGYLLLFMTPEMMQMVGRLLE